MYKDIEKQGKCWTPEKANSYYNKFPLLLGFNYIPSNAVNSTDMWQKDSFDIETIEKELDLASKYGYNCTRVFLPYIVFEKERDVFLCNFEKYLRVSFEKGFYTIPIMFDDCAFAGEIPFYGKQQKPVPFVHNSRWTASPGADMSTNLTTFSKLREYLSNVICAHLNDQRIFMWDLYNECGNNNMGASSLYLLSKAFEWARALGPSQPLTACLWAKEFPPAPESAHMCDMYALEHSDILTFHLYANKNNTEKLIEKLQKTGYPIVCTEWMARTLDSNFKDILPLFESKKIGSIHWGLVNGKTQTHYPWGWDKEKGEPTVWFHDVFKKDGTPYDASEMAIVSKIACKIKP